MSQSLQIFLWIPLIGFIISLFLPSKKESFVSLAAISVVGIYLIGIIAFVIYWLIDGHPILDIKHLVLFKTDNVEIFIDYYFDKTTAVFALVGSTIAFLVFIFSRYYMHREAGFKRYFCTMLLFFLGYNIVIFAGNFETLFTGWELLGISSFLLITFFRDRYLPVKNGLKVVSLYRFTDICLILAMWMSHHFWHENITFIKLNDLALVSEHLHQYYWSGIFIALMIFIAGAAKSAQLPFSSWLPRAMEGPTSSSAIFYGSLSVHLGAFLLLRTYPFWESLIMIKILIIATGLLTAIIANSIAKVQSSVKTQIAYSSITQIGLIFIEVALGFHFLALLHFAGNAFLRSYQLLVSPSVLSYLTHDMFFSFKPKDNKPGIQFFDKIKNTIYVLSIKEWNLDFMLRRFLWDPFKWLGKKLNFITGKFAIVLLIILYLAGLYSNLYPGQIPLNLYEILPIIFTSLALLLILKAFTERGDAIRAWLLVTAGQFFLALSIALLNVNFGIFQILIYLSGVIISAIAGYICLKKIRAIDNNIDLNQFHGYTYEQKKIGLIFLLSCLGMVGLPLTPTFIGIDLLFNNIHKHEGIIIILTSLSFMILEISILRIYSRIFMGQHKKAYHAMAYRSS